MVAEVRVTKSEITGQTRVELWKGTQKVGGITLNKEELEDLARKIPRPIEEEKTL